MSYIKLSVQLWKIENAYVQNQNIFKCYHLKSNTIDSNSIDIFKQKAINRDYRQGLIHNQS